LPAWAQTGGQPTTAPQATIVAAAGVCKSLRTDNEFVEKGLTAVLGAASTGTSRKQFQNSGKGHLRVPLAGLPAVRTPTRTPVRSGPQRSLPDGSETSRRLSLRFFPHASKCPRRGDGVRTTGGWSIPCSGRRRMRWSRRGLLHAPHRRFERMYLG
jgi:hypothetical protein